MALCMRNLYKMRKQRSLNTNDIRFDETDALTDRYVGLTGAQIFHKLMGEHGVEHIFGYPGGAILPVFDAIYESPHFKFILTRHEQGAGHMAEGYARATGKPGVVLVTSGSWCDEHGDCVARRFDGWDTDCGVFGSGGDFCDWYRRVPRS